MYSRRLPAVVLGKPPGKYSHFNPWRGFWRQPVTVLMATRRYAATSASLSFVSAGNVSREKFGGGGTPRNPCPPEFLLVAMARPFCWWRVVFNGYNLRTIVTGGVRLSPVWFYCPGLLSCANVSLLHCGLGRPGPKYPCNPRVRLIAGGRAFGHAVYKIDDFILRRLPSPSVLTARQHKGKGQLHQLSPLLQVSQKPGIRLHHPRDLIQVVFAIAFSQGLKLSRERCPPFLVVHPDRFRDSVESARSLRHFEKLIHELLLALTCRHAPE